MKANELSRKLALRAKRKARIRAKVFGTSDSPRVTVFKSNKNFLAQAIDDVAGHTLVYVTTVKTELKPNRDDVKKLALEFANGLKAKNITNIVFDRNGYLYHGVIASFADALRENGINF